MQGEATVAIKQYMATSGRYGDDYGVVCKRSPPGRAKFLEFRHDVVQQERFKGIRYRPELGRYISEIRPAQPRKRKIWLGTFKTAEEAARAFDAGIFYTKKPVEYNFEDSPSILEPLPENLSPEQEHIEIQKRAKAAAARVEPSQSERPHPGTYAKFSDSYSSQKRSKRYFNQDNEYCDAQVHRPPREIQFWEVLNRS